MKSSTIIASLTAVTFGLAIPAHGFADNVSMFQQDPSKHHHYDNPAPQIASYDTSTYHSTASSDTYYSTTAPSAGATGASTESSWSSQGSTVPVQSKASGLVGKKVENQQGEKLGKIKDVVVAQQPGNEAFAVIEKADHAKGTSPSVAVPITAIQSSPDMKYVRVQANKYQFDNMH